MPLNSVVREVISERIERIADELERLEAERSILLDQLAKDEAERDAAGSTQAAGPIFPKPPHWSQTPEGRKKLARQGRALWKKRRAKAKK